VHSFAEIFLKAADGPADLHGPQSLEHKTKKNADTKQTLVEQLHLQIAIIVLKCNAQMLA